MAATNLSRTTPTHNSKRRALVGTGQMTVSATNLMEASDARSFTDTDDDMIANKRLR